MLLSRAFDRGDPLRCACDGVVSKMHRRGAGMVGAAQKCELQPALPGNGFDHCQRPIQFLQNRSLLDVKFKIAQRIVAQTGLRNFCRDSGQTPRSPCARKFLAHLGRSRSSSSSRAHQRAAADEWQCRSVLLLLRKIQRPRSRREAFAPRSSSSKRNGKHHSENAVISAGVRNGIEVRTDQQPWSAWLAQPDKLRADFRRHRSAPRLPSGSIQRAISWWQSRMGGERNVRRVLPASSEKDASFRHRAMTSSARVVHLSRRGT